MNNEFCIIVVLYYPNDDILQKYKMLDKEYNVVMVDNTPEYRNSNEPNFSNYIPLHNNLGIGYAQNIGIKYAINHGFNYIVFFDQDSDVLNLRIDKIISDFEELRTIDNQTIAMGLLPVNQENNRIYKNTALFSPQGFARVEGLISSSTVVFVDSLMKVGVMDESLFIDLVDFDWCWRATQAGFHLYITNRQILNHSVGSTAFMIGGVQFVKSAPLRYFYRYRNTLWLCRKKYVPNKWKWKNLLKIPFEMIIILIYNVYKGKRVIILKNALKGIKHGLCSYEKSINIS